MLFKFFTRKSVQISEDFVPKQSSRIFYLAAYVFLFTMVSVTVLARFIRFPQKANFRITFENSFSSGQGSQFLVKYNCDKNRFLIHQPGQKVRIQVDRYPANSYGILMTEIVSSSSGHEKDERVLVLKPLNTSTSPQPMKLIKGMEGSAEVILNTISGFEFLKRKLIPDFLNMSNGLSSSPKRAANFRPVRNI